MFQTDGHSREHYESEKHVYAMDIETRTVWDFCKVLLLFYQIPRRIMFTD